MAVTSFYNTSIGLSSANFTPSKAPTGLLADISKQVGTIYLQHNSQPIRYHLSHQYLTQSLNMNCATL